MSIQKKHRKQLAKACNDCDSLVWQMMNDNSGFLLADLLTIADWAESGMSFNNESSCKMLNKIHDKMAEMKIIIEVFDRIYKDIEDINKKEHPNSLTN